jgi:signal transduction histidine kinase
MGTSAPSKAFQPTLVAAFSLAVLTTLAMGSVGLLIVRSLRASLMGAAARAHRLTQVHELRFDLEKVVATARGYLVSPDNGRRTRAEAAIDSARTSLQAFNAPAVGSRRRALIERVRRAAAAYVEAIEETLRADGRGGAKAAALFDDEMAPKRDELDAALSTLVTAEDAHADLQFRESEASASRAVGLLFGFGGASLLLSFASAWFFGRWLLRIYESEQRAVVVAQRALAERAELLAIIAHDLRSPLSAIMMKAAFIRKQAETVAHGGKLAKQAATIESTTTRMEALIQGLLDATTIEAGQFSVALGPCDAAGLVSAAFEIFEPLAARKALRLVIASLPPEPVFVRADRERIMQVLSNLLANAIKFTPEGGSISLEAKAGGQNVRFSVSDTGPGIPTEYLPHLFSRYWKAEQGGRRGAGLGLYIAKGIVQSHGGTLWVESTLGKGSTFFFTLPIWEDA